MTGARPHRRQVVLFLVAVILPSLLLVALWIRMISQDREIQRSRLADGRRAVLADIRNAALAELDRIEDGAMSVLEETLAGASRDYFHPDVRLVARVTGGSVVAPWEEAPNLREARRMLAEPGFAGRIRSGRRAEEGRSDHTTAARIYRAAIVESRSATQEAMARLLLARAVAAGTGREAAEPLYGELLALPSTVVDEFGVPFAFYAATRLLDWGAATEEVGRRLRSDVDASDWRSPTAFYRLADLWSTVGGDTAALAAERLQVESVPAVQRDYSLLESNRASARGNGTAGPVWLGVQAGDWLVKAVGPAGSEPAAVVAVSAASLARRLEESEAVRSSAVGALEIGLPGAAEGTAIGVARPDFMATFTEPPDAALGPVIGLRNAFFFGALMLVLSITLFGGYLLLQDVKREMRTAELRSDFVSSVSHELKTPLTAIRMFAEMLRARTTVHSTADGVTGDYLDTIVGESERLTRLLNNVLDLSKIEQGQKTYSREPTSLGDVATRAARALEYAMESEGFRLHLDLDERLPLASVDRDSMEQAVLNLLTNAMKYSGDSRDIDLGLRAENGHAVIAVRDRGIGVPPESRPRLTEKFFRVISPENDGIPGTGLGLTIVEHTARAHGGFVTIDSRVGEGSTFSIHLPLEAQP